MPETTQYTIGAQASCSDGPCGEVTRVVVDPVAKAVTHIVVEPKHRSGLGRLVPVSLVNTSAGEVRLDCDMAGFDKLDRAEETHFLPEAGGGYGGYGGYGPGQALAWPYYGLGGMGLAGGLGMGGGMGGGLGMGGGMGTGLGGNASQPVVYDTVPLGEVTVRRGEQVHASDGAIGAVQGLVIDPRNHHVTHVLLQEGHLWGRKEVAIPITAVKDVDDGIRLNMTKQQVQDLAPVDIDHPDGQTAGER